MAFPSGLVRSHPGFLLSFNYPLRVLIPFKVIAKASRTSGILTLNRPGGGGSGIRPQAGSSLCCAETVSSKKLKLCDFLLYTNRLSF